MSDALREMQDKADADFNYRSTHDEDGEQIAETPPIEGETPETPEAKPESTEAEKLKPKAQPEQPPQKKEPKPSKFQQARTDAEALRDAREANKRHKGEIEELKRGVTELKAILEQRIKAEETAKDPTEALLAKGYKPEDAEKEAQKREAEGDIDGAVAAREVAREMRARLEQRAQAQQQQAQQHLIPGTPQFAEVWKSHELNLVNIEHRYGDEEDKELIKGFAVNGSEIDKAIKDFIANDPLGQQASQDNKGIYFIYQVVKNRIKIGRLKTENDKLRKELGRSTSLTSLGSSAPVTSGGSNGHKRFEDMSTKEMGEYLREKAQRQS